MIVRRGLPDHQGVRLDVDSGDLFGQATIINLLGAELSAASKYFFDNGKEFPRLAKSISSIFNGGTRDGVIESQLMASLQMEMAGTVLGLDTKAKKDSLLVEVKRVVDAYERFLTTKKDSNAPAN